MSTSKNNTNKINIKISDYFDGCGTLSSIGEVPILSREDQDKLLLKIKKGDEIAKHELALSNMRLAYAIANKYKGLAGTKTFLDTDDLIMLGYEGLLKACNNFKSENIGKIAFSTYATFWLKQIMTREIDNATVAARIPVHTVQDVFYLMRKVSKLEQETGIHTTIEDMCAMISDDPKISRNESSIVQALNIMGAVSLYTPVGEEEDSVLADFISFSSTTPEDEAIVKHTVQIIKEALEELPDNQRLVIDRRFGLSTGICETLEQIGNDMNLSRERIRQLESNAIKTLKSKRKVNALLM